MKSKLLFSLFALFTILLLNGCSKKIDSVTIGNQVWMKANLDVDHYRNGDTIPEIKGAKEWANLKIGAWCYYDNDPENGKKYGKLYNWYAVNDHRGLAPEGWHIPSNAQFEALKAVGQGTRVGTGTNTSGFSGLLAGNRYSNNGYFHGLEGFASFWSSIEYNATSAYGMGLSDNDSTIYMLINVSKEEGFSIRCLKDN